MNKFCDDERAFLKGILENPEDEAIRLIYADWLEEHNRLEESEWLRWESKWHCNHNECHLNDRNRINELRKRLSSIDKQWMILVTRGKIQNCRIYEKECPGTWQNIKVEIQDNQDGAWQNIRIEIQDNDAYEIPRLSKECPICEREVILVLSQYEAELRYQNDQVIVAPEWMIHQREDLDPNEWERLSQIPILNHQNDPRARITRKMQKRARRSFEQ